LISFRIGGTAVRISFSFLAFNALLFLMRSGGEIFAFYTACAVHEAGHIAVLALTGSRVAAVELSAAGIVMETEKSSLSSLRKGLAVLAAGPAAGLLMFAALRAAGCGGSFPILNLMAAAYNMLPYRCLDGGAMIALLTLGSVHERALGLLLTALKLLITAAAGAAVYLLGREALPLLFGASVLLICDSVKS